MNTFTYDPEQFIGREPARTIGEIAEHELEPGIFTLRYFEDHQKILQSDPNDSVKLSEVSRYIPGFGAQTQYILNCLSGVRGEEMGLGLRWETPQPGDCHRATIALADVEEFLRRRFRSHIGLEIDYLPEEE